MTPAPDQVLEPDTLLPPEKPVQDLPSRQRALPPEGARLALVIESRLVGWLDIWGNGTPASMHSRRALSDVARLVAVVIAGSACE